MNAKSEDREGFRRKLRHKRLQEKKIEKKYERILSELDEKARDLEKSLEDLEEELVVSKKFDEKIQAKRSAIAQLALKKDELQTKLKELEMNLRHT